MSTPEFESNLQPQETKVSFLVDNASGLTCVGFTMSDGRTLVMVAEDAIVLGDCLLKAGNAAVQMNNTKNGAIN